MTPGEAIDDEIDVLETKNRAADEASRLRI